MRKIIFFAVCCYAGLALMAQPYIDIVSFRYVHSPDAGTWRRNNQHNYFEYYNAGVNLPFVLKKDSSIILLSPYAERWDINFINAVGNFNDLSNHLNALVLPLTYIKPVTANWGLSFSAIPRWNGSDLAIFKNSFQLGGAVLASYKKTNTLVLKFGLYYNSELSGAFFVPLLGIDWQINKSNCLFGVLPGNLALEHRFSSRLLCGFSFKAITNTCDAGSILYINNTGITSNGKYLRIDENQLNLFVDFYCSKHLVINLEMGHAVFRKMRIGLKDPAVKYYYHDKMNDDLLLKASLNYRLRFKGR